MTTTFELYRKISDEDCQPRIAAAKAALGKDLVILGHHYQRADVYKHADLTGDSLQLSRLASQTTAKYIVFCGVHFMAEVADILTKPEQVVMLPDLSAGCSMADMADVRAVNRAWREIGESLKIAAAQQFTPVTYVNSAADLKAFCAENGGTVCTSTNAPEIMKWAFSQREKILFFPDQHLGRWTGYMMGIPPGQMVVWDPFEFNGGLTVEQLQQAKVVLWKGHCSVHQMFQASHINVWRDKNPDGLVISHPECNFEVCKLSDYVGSTDFIIRKIRESQPGAKWLVGTELNLVNRIAEEMKPKGVTVKFMSPFVCQCSTMARIDPQHLLWCLENLVQDEPVNIISVPTEDATLAKVALERMLSL